MSAHQLVWFWGGSGVEQGSGIASYTATHSRGSLQSGVQQEASLANDAASTGWSPFGMLLPAGEGKKPNERLK